MEKKKNTLDAEVWKTKTHSNLEFGPVVFGSIRFVYMARKEELGLILILYSAKEFCLIEVYTMLLMLTILLWLSDIWFIFRRYVLRKKKYKISYIII